MPIISEMLEPSVSMFDSFRCFVSKPFLDLQIKLTRHEGPQLPELASGSIRTPGEGITARVHLPPTIQGLKGRDD